MAIDFNQEIKLPTTLNVDPAKITSLIISSFTLILFFYSLFFSFSTIYQVNRADNLSASSQLLNEGLINQASQLLQDETITFESQ